MLLQKNIFNDYQVWSADPANTNFEDFVVFAANKYKTKIDRMVMILNTFDWAKDKVQIAKQQLDQAFQLSIQIENEKKNVQNLIKDETQAKQLYREWMNNPATKSLNVFVELIAKKYNVSNDAALTALKTFNWIPSN